MRTSKPTTRKPPWPTRSRRRANSNLPHARRGPKGEASRGDMPIADADAFGQGIWELVDPDEDGEPEPEPGDFWFQPDGDDE